MKYEVISTGRFKCPYFANWLLIYKVEGDCLVLTLTRTGSHSDLFGLKINLSGQILL